jgi:hypothetical protein
MKKRYTVEVRGMTRRLYAVDARDIQEALANACEAAAEAGMKPYEANIVELKPKRKMKTERKS